MTGHAWIEGEGFVEDEDVHGVVIPAPIDAHTHVGDRVGRGRDLAGFTLAQVVAPPDGLKHRLLRETPRDALVAGMRAALEEMLAGGTRTFIDFREQGVEGTRMLRDAAQGLPVRPIVMARCERGFDEAEAARVLAEADGYGWSGLADAEGAERAASLCRRQGKRFALHFSEAAREDVGRALDLRPDLLVHATRCTREDLRAIADARVPVALCPRSNARFGAFPDWRAMLDEGVRLSLGSDNAMLHELGVLHDARLLAARGMARKDALALALSRDLDDDAATVTLGSPSGDPFDAVFGPAPPRIVEVHWTKG